LTRIITKAVVRVLGARIERREKKEEREAGYSPSLIGIW
jgi:hypothetical protein